MSHTELPLISSGRKPLVSVIVTMCVLMVALLGVMFGIQARSSQDFSGIAPSILVAAVCCLTAVALLRIVGRTRATVEQGDLVMQTGVGKKRVPLSHLRKHGIEVVDLAKRPELKPWLRWWGTSMPGLSTGWFRLRNGEKAVCLLTDRRRVSYLRSDVDNVSLLLSLQNPEALKALLER